MEARFDTDEQIVRCPVLRVSFLCLSVSVSVSVSVCLLSLYVTVSIRFYFFFSDFFDKKFIGKVPLSHPRIFEGRGAGHSNLKRQSILKNQSSRNSNSFK